MTDGFILASATGVLPTETVRGSVAVVDSRIAAMDQGAAVPKGAIDCGGDYTRP